MPRKKGKKSAAEPNLSDALLLKNLTKTCLWTKSFINCTSTSKETNLSRAVRSIAIALQRERRVHVFEAR